MPSKRPCTFTRNKHVKKIAYYTDNKGIFPSHLLVFDRCKRLQEYDNFLRERGYVLSIS